LDRFFSHRLRNDHNDDDDDDDDIDNGDDDELLSIGSVSPIDYGMITMMTMTMTMISTTATTTTTTTTTKKKKKKKKKERSSSRLSRHNVTHRALSWRLRGEPLLETNSLPIRV
jgi:hypothetical protein